MLHIISVECRGNYKKKEKVSFCLYFEYSDVKLNREFAERLGMM